MGEKPQCITGTGADIWTNREHLCLASAVVRNGNNWNAVSRTVRLLSIETNRPNDWYSNKNCSLQYNKILEQVDTPKSKKETLNETPEEILLNHLSQKRIEELKAVLEEEKTSYDKLLTEIQTLETNQHDSDILQQFWDDVIKDQEKEDAQEKSILQWTKEREDKNRLPLVKQFKDAGTPILAQKMTGSCIQPSHDLKKEITSSENSSEMDSGDDLETDVQPICSSSSSLSMTATPKSSPKVSLPRLDCSKNSKVIDIKEQNDPFDELQKDIKDDIKSNSDKDSSKSEADIIEESCDPIEENIEESQLVEEQLKQESCSEPSPKTDDPSDQDSDVVKLDENKSEIISSEESSSAPEPILKPDKEESNSSQELEDACLDLKEVSLVAKSVSKGDKKTEPPPKKKEESDTRKRALRGNTAPFVSEEAESSSGQKREEEDEEEEISASRRGRKRKNLPVKEEEKLKKNSSSDTKSRPKKDGADDSPIAIEVKESPSSVNPQLLVEKLEKIQDKKKETQPKPQKKDEYEFDDDASRESTDVKDFLLRSERRKQSMNESISSPVVSESTPSSPASTNYGDDPESERLHRQWKKAIMLVWNEIASHKNASIFLKPITEDKVPGYQSVVYRPMDLQTIKRGMENGMIRSTTDFQRDIMLIFLNAKMYNTDDHICRLADEMLKDSIEVIEEFINAQSPAKVVETPQKSLRRETRESSAKRVEDRKREEREDKPLKRRKI